MKTFAFLGFMLSTLVPPLVGCASTAEDDSEEAAGALSESDAEATNKLLSEAEAIADKYLGGKNCAEKLTKASILAKLREAIRLDPSRELKERIAKNRKFSAALGLTLDYLHVSGRITIEQERIRGLAGAIETLRFYGPAGDHGSQRSTVELKKGGEAYFWVTATLESPQYGRWDEQWKIPGSYTIVESSAGTQLELDLKIAAPQAEKLKMPAGKRTLDISYSAGGFLSSEGFSVSGGREPLLKLTTLPANECS